MNSEKPIIVKRSTQSQVLPQLRSQLVQPSVIEPVEQPEIEQPEQPKPAIQLQSLAEPPIDQSIYGSGWSVAELLNEFSGRYDG